MADVRLLWGQVQVLQTRGRVPEVFQTLLERLGSNRLYRLDVGGINGCRPAARAGQQAKVLELFDQVFPLDASEREDRPRVLGEPVGDDQGRADRVLAPAQFRLRFLAGAARLDGSA